MKNSIAVVRGRMFVLFCKIFKKNVTVGPGLKIFKKLSIEGSGKIKIGKNCTVKGIVGDNSQYVCLGTQSKFSEIKIGDNAKLYAARVYSKFSVIIGNNIHIEESGISDTDFHSIERQRGEPDDESLEKCRIEICDGVFIGAKSFVGKGVRVGENSKIWPGSIVTGSVPPEVTICGNPARPFKN